MVDQAGLEGMVSKRLGSRYVSGSTTNWLKTKCYTIGEFELLGVEREHGKPAFALMAEPGTRKYVGSAFVSINREVRERLWKRVQEHAGPPPKDSPNGRRRSGSSRVSSVGVKHLRGGSATCIFAGLQRGLSLSTKELFVHRFEGRN
ncbi:hypothetical protein [Mesorhizobium sp. M0816]|uniref:hypothetical protein n=1 Tax=Mesorhizobium sp. M0816 TaxID=2957006 RepID=UPI003339C76C